LGYEGYSSILDNTFSGSNDFLTAIKKLYKEVGAPSGLQSWGFSKSSDVKLMTERTIIERQGNLDLNPILFDEKSVERVLNKCII
jgi:alcohol dehydrogenase class IV